MVVVTVDVVHGRLLKRLELLNVNLDIMARSSATAETHLVESQRRSEMVPGDRDRGERPHITTVVLVLPP
jgi:hypothetical protein